MLGEPGCGKQLAVTFLKDARPLGLTTANVSISGGAAVEASSIEPIAAEDPTVVTFDLNHTGDFSTYTFALVAGPESGEPPPGMDPVLASVEFSFKAGCPTPADCLPSDCCPSDLPAPPDINYLAKDYPGFLQVMRDRLAVLTPAWTETHAADLGVAITEALAYAADHLSYQQDAVSTEAYIDTARSRISLRRHARLVDYQLSEGCNARTLVAVTTATEGLPIPAGTLFYTGAPGLPCAARDGDPVAQQLAEAAQPVFTAMRESVLYLAHNEIDFYTWADADCCLPQGATQATLEGNAGEPRGRRHADLRGGPRTRHRPARGRRPRPPLRRMPDCRKHHGPREQNARRSAHRHAGDADRLGPRRRTAFPTVHLLHHRRRTRLPADRRGLRRPGERRARRSWRVAERSRRGARHRAGSPADAGGGRRLQLWRRQHHTRAAAALLSIARALATDLQRPLSGRELGRGVLLT